MTPGRPAGAYLTPSKPERDGQFEIFEQLDPKTNERRDYVKGPNENKPSLFYTHERSIAPCIGHQGRLLLINDYFTTKACRVVIADIKTHTTWKVSSGAQREYDQKVRPDPRLVVVPEAYGFSPDDHRVLIGMDLIWTSAPATMAANQLDKTYKPRWYVVDSSTGRVLHEYQAKRPPSCWWLF